MATPHPAQPVVVVARTSRKGAALVAAGAAIALVGGAGSFALLSETHTVTQVVTAGGELGLTVTVDGTVVEDGAIILTDMVGKLPGESTAREIVVENTGDIAATISLNLNGDFATDDGGAGEALASLVNVTVEGDGIQLTGTVADLVETPAESGGEIILDVGDDDGETLDLTVTVEIDRDASDVWVSAARGEVSAILTITGDQVTDPDDAGA